MKVLFIDTSYIEYSQEFVKSLRKNIDATIIRKYYTEDKNAIPIFYKYSELMRKRGSIYRIIRGFEYFFNYIHVVFIAKKNKYDIIHIQWPQIVVFDKLFFKILKKYCSKLVYTAHDVIPHESTRKKIENFRKLYCIPDKIIVHGNFCKDEFKEYFPESLNKVFIQMHGVSSLKNDFNNTNLFEKHKNLSSIKNKLVFTFIGQISPYKGLDLLLEAWENFKTNQNVFLLVVGKTTFDYIELHKAFDKIKNFDNVYIYNERYSSEEESFFYNLSDIIVLPYKTASMSGVLFTAAKYNKTILTTEVGCITEYIRPIKNDVFTCKYDINSLSNEINKITNTCNKNMLGELGKKFNKKIQNLYNWDIIVKNVIDNCYKQ